MVRKTNAPYVADEMTHTHVGIEKHQVVTCP
jgi:hypothetical protein